MAGSFDFPNGRALSDDKENLLPSPPWVQWFQLVQGSTVSVRQSGVTADRPATGLWIGRIYYDTTLGKPVWVHGVKPTVWHDASGAVA